MCAGLVGFGCDVDTGKLTRQCMYDPIRERTSSFITHDPFHLQHMDVCAATTIVTEERE